MMYSALEGTTKDGVCHASSAISILEGSPCLGGSAGALSARTKFCGESKWVMIFLRCYTACVGIVEDGEEKTSMNATCQNLASNINPNLIFGAEGRR